MAKQTPINETTAIQSAESLEQETVPMVEQVEEVTTVTEPIKVDPSSMPTGVIVQAILSSTFAEGARLTGYQLHTVINVAFQILQIEKDGAILQIKPQMIYNATKLGKGETYDLVRSLTFITSYVERRRSGMVSQGERLNSAAMMANALKALS